MERPRVVIVGAGPAGLMAASVVMAAADVLIVDQKKKPGRKFLVAGDGGLNLTHSEDFDSFLSRYDSGYIRSCVRDFTPLALREWLNSIGVETVVGSSGKIFPADRYKPVDVLNAITSALSASNVKWQMNSRLQDFTASTLAIDSDSGPKEIAFDFLILAMGGGSWAVTGSDGKWRNLFQSKDLECVDFQSSNAGIELKNTEWCSRFEGNILKNIVLRTEKQQTSGDLTITAYGIEGKPAYAANHAVRENTALTIDFKPQLAEEELAEKLRNVPVRKGFERVKLPGSIYELVRENTPKEDFVSPVRLAALLKNFPLLYTGLRPVEEAISTVGGLDLSEIDETGELKRFPNIFCAGEMLDWDAPTGGYLLQGCFASGRMAGLEILRRINDRDTISN